MACFLVCFVTTSLPLVSYLTVLQIVTKHHPAVYRAFRTASKNVFTYSDRRQYRRQVEGGGRCERAGEKGVKKLGGVLKVSLSFLE